MNDQRVKTDNPNASICEFMGYEKSRDIWEKDEYAYTMKLPSVFNKWVIPSHMLFTKSWDWFMPVVDKINKLENSGELKGIDLDIIRSMHEWISMVKLENACADAVSIIKWYQKQKSS